MDKNIANLNCAPQSLVPTAVLCALLLRPKENTSARQGAFSIISSKNETPIHIINEVSLQIT